MKINMPRNPDEQAKLGDSIVVRAKSDGANSPLKIILTDTIEEKIAMAESKSKQAAELRRQSEVLVEERNNLLQEVNQFIKSSRDILLALYPEEPKKLTEYGFDVVTSTTSKAPESVK